MSNNIQILNDLKDMATVTLDFSEYDIENRTVMGNSKTQTKDCIKVSRCL